MNTLEGEGGVVLRGSAGSRIGIGGGSGHGSGGLVVVEGWEGKEVGSCWIEGVVRLPTEAHVAVAVLVHRGEHRRRWRIWWDRDGCGHGRVSRLNIATAEDVRGRDGSSGGVGAGPYCVSACQSQGGGVASRCRCEFGAGAVRSG